MVEAFGPDEVEEESVTFLETDEAVAKRIIQRTRENLKVIDIPGRVHQATVSKKGLSIIEDRQAATVGIGTKLKVPVAVKQVVGDSFMRAGWKDVEIEEGEQELKITLVAFKVS